MKKAATHSVMTHLTTNPGKYKADLKTTFTIPELQAMDLYNQSYCFCKSGQEIKKAFPEYANEKSPVLFIVKLKA